MIFFFNGAHKNASHFQLMIVTEALKQKGLPFDIVGDLHFDNTRLFKSGPKEGKKILDGLAAQPDKLHICKAHWGTQTERDLLLSYPNLKIFLIWRDLRDVLVSSYHFHNKREDGAYDSFESFYRLKGRSIAFFQVVYRHNWRAVSDPRIFHLDFKAIKNDFQLNAQEMLAFAGLSDIDLAALKKEVDIGRLREKHGDEKSVIFRRGVVGEHEDLIPTDILEDIAWIQGLSKTELYWRHFHHNPKVILKKDYEFKGQDQLLWALRKVGFGGGQ